MTVFFVVFVVYAVGGFNGSLRVKTVDVFDPQTGKWSSAPPMNARRLIIDFYYD